MGSKSLTKMLPLFAAVLLFNSDIAFSLTLKDAIFLARKNLPSHRASKIRVESEKSLYKASLSPYLPTLDASGTRKHLNTRSDGYDINDYGVSINYTLFDGGERKAKRNIARLNLNSTREELRKDLIGLEHKVKVMYFTAVTKKEILKQRRLQIKDALKDYEIAEGKHRLGTTLRSDVLQASVRVKQAKFDKRQAEGDLAKAMFNLNSLLGRPLETGYDLEDRIITNITIPDRDKLSLLSLENPLALQARNNVEISQNNITLAQSDFYPTLSTKLSYDNTKTNKEFDDKSTENKSVAVIASMNIFEWGKYYKKKSSRQNIRVSKEELNDVKRRLVLEVYNKYEDLLTSAESLTLAKQQLIEAKFNYDQALGEYKEGKGDILSLVRAESLLSDARNLMSKARLDFAISKAALEQAVGIEDLESMKKVYLP